ncbi:MAG TPA: hypothetical protein VN958_04795, partial [Chitinophagaceae bacterium]|nr:hypothetical protein [Chitinophagaceae bacterium]
MVVEENYRIQLLKQHDHYCPSAAHTIILIRIYFSPLRKKIKKIFCETKRFHLFMRRDVFQGIADLTRREIINLLSHKSVNVNSVAENFDLSRTAI